MSRDQAREFVKKVKSDNIVGNTVKQAFRELLVRMGKEAGFVFSPADLESALAEMKSEISEESLAGIAGGVGTRRVVK